MNDPTPKLRDLEVAGHVVHTDPVPPRKASDAGKQFPAWCLRPSGLKYAKARHRAVVDPPLAKYGDTSYAPRNAEWSPVLPTPLWKHDVGALSATLTLAALRAARRETPSVWFHGDHVINPPELEGGEWPRLAAFDGWAGALDTKITFTAVGDGSDQLTERRKTGRIRPDGAVLEALPSPSEDGPIAIEWLVEFERRRSATDLVDKFDRYDMALSAWLPALTADADGDEARPYGPAGTLPVALFVVPAGRLEHYVSVANKRFRLLRTATDDRREGRTRRGMPGRLTTVFIDERELGDVAALSTMGSVDAAWLRRPRRVAVFGDTPDMPPRMELLDDYVLQLVHSELDRRAVVPPKQSGRRPGRGGSVPSTIDSMS